MLFNDRLECASCHDVHNSYNQAGLLVKSNADSALCLTCHRSRRRGHARHPRGPR